MENDHSQDALRVLVVEDEALIGMLLEDMITELGAALVGPFTTLASALAAVTNDNYDVALVDLNLNGEQADEVARQLAGRSVPFALASGSPETDPQLGQTTVLQKPFSFDDIAAVLKRLGGTRGNGLT